MDMAKLQEQLMQTFLAELSDRVQSFGADLLALENVTEPADRQARVQSLFRTAHSLKGAARSVGLGLLEQVCHETESVLSAVREGKLEMNRRTLDALFGVLESIQQASERLRRKETLEDGPLSAIPAVLKALLMGNNLPLVRGPPAASGSLTFPVPDKAQGATAMASAGDLLRVRASRIDAALMQQTELAAVKELAQEWPRVLEELHRDVKAFRRHTRSRGSVNHSEDDEALGSLEQKLDQLGRSLSAGHTRLARAVDGTGEILLRLRMVPFSEACEGLPLLVRNVASVQGKQVALTIQGGALELDRAIVQGLRDTLVHLVRNAIEHGLEMPAGRQAQGKPTTGRITVSAALTGNRVLVTVQDDGRGLNLEAIRAKASALGLPRVADDRDALQIIFTPGFSTATTVTADSGRGVGLDVVKTQVEALHGTVSAISTPIAGSRFEMLLPLTLLSLQGLVVRSADTSYVFLEAGVRAVLRLDREDIRVVGGGETLWFENRHIPVFSLSGVLGDGGLPSPNHGGKLRAVVLVAGEQIAAFVVDEIVTVQFVVLKPLDPRWGRVPLVAGSTEFADGRLGIVLNASPLLAYALEHAVGRELSVAATGPTRSKVRLLLVDDSLTTRMLIKSLLEADGYEVLIAGDGNEAWRRLQDERFDVVISDVEMPECTGFELLERIRSSHDLQALPVILLTGLETDADKRRGLNLGANAYLVKSAFDQTQLIRTIGQLV